MVYFKKKFIYFFVLGHNPGLSVEEIFSYFFKEKIAFNFVFASREVLALELKKEIKEDFLLSQLGGTVKIGRIFYFVRREEKILPVWLSHLLKKETKRIHFGISCYLIEKGIKNYSKIFIKSMAMSLKEFLKAKGWSVRWVSSLKNPLSSVIVKKNYLLEKGGEIVFCINKNGYFLGKVLAVQSFADYSFRDYQRPERDIKTGMLPPKLAKIMINLSQVRKDKVILDPFCGSGTILQEALLLGFDKVVGSDKEKKALEKTKKNLNWLLNKYSLKKAEYKLVHSPVENLSSRLGDILVKAIVTEPYLGPLKIDEKEVDKVIKQLSLIYLKAFKEFSRILAKGGKVIIIFPVFSLAKKKFFLPLFSKIKKIGFQQNRPLILDFDLKKIFQADFSYRNTLIYSRPSQHILREIVFWTKF